MMRRLLLPVLLICACDASESSDAVTQDGARETLAADWPAPGTGTIDYRTSREFDFHLDDSDEKVTVSARGPAYDSLTIVLSITNVVSDTLWKEEWTSLLYFQYEPLEGKADSTVARIVQGHINALLADSSFSDAGLPIRLRHGDVRSTMREAVRYHLAELDWRRTMAYPPEQPTPPEAHGNIATDAVPVARANAVADELMVKPSFTYFAGGEATYAIAWSVAENGFVRIFACC